jgi:hypothetical protein
MRKGGGHQKGSSFERKVAKLIAKAFRRLGIEQRDCWRSVLSGGHIISSGDLAMTDRLLDLFPVSIECKFYKRIHWERFLMPEFARQPSWQEWKWWVQACEGAEKRKDRTLKPVLVMKENRGPIYVLYESLDDGLWLVPLKKYLARAVKRAEKRRAA